jgi:D-serine deaminase-like pyridoxal phosphate-dependent protein
MIQPRTINDIPTPALILDVPTMERNIRRMAEFFAEGPTKLRPHFKAHKTPEIARRQLAAGSCVGLTCATVGEAEVAAGFCEDILIANQVIGLDKCARVAILAKSGVDIKVAVESELGLEQMSKAALDTETTVGVLVEVPVG